MNYFIYKKFLKRKRSREINSNNNFISKFWFSIKFQIKCTAYSAIILNNTQI